MGNVDTHRATHEAFNRRDYEGAAGPMREDAIYTDHPRNADAKGPLEFIDYIKGWTTAFSDARVTDPHYIEGDDHTVCLFHGQGTNDGPLGSLPATGKRLDLPFCEVLRYDHHGKIVAGELFYDSLTMLVQLGHAKPIPEI